MALNQIVDPDFHLLAYFTELFCLFEERGSAKLTKFFIHLYPSPFILFKSNLDTLKILFESPGFCGIRSGNRE
jgi:hypothetical protein